MGFLTTWAVDGSRTPAAVARTATYAGSKEPGVVEPWHLRTIPIAPGTVAVTAGAVLIQGGTTGTRRWQMYLAVVDSGDGNATATVVMPSSSSRTLYTVVVIPDPELAGVAAPSDPLTAVYAELRLLTLAQYSNLTIPKYLVSTIVIPANATAITEAMITNQRSVAQPRSKRVQRAHRVNTTDTDVLDTGGSVGEAWPNIGPYLVDCPTWATRAIVTARFDEVYIPGGEFTAALWVGIGPGNLAVDTAESVVRQYAGGSQAQRSFGISDTVDIPEVLRGTEVGIATYGRIVAGTAYPVLRSGSGVSIDVEFQERAV
ncbi:MAG: hypothetical protein M3Q39_09970 [Actinomycetota bacterium]|nr:hypothetical protein [Actinomycetota bacterium]